jgi:putative intracellular protease/amidase
MSNILIIVANPGVSTTIGTEVGFWASELIHPYDAFIKKGHEVTIASPKGGKVIPDALSDPRHESGYSESDTLSLRYLEDENFNKKLISTVPISKVSKEDFDAILVAGGQSPMFTFEEAKNLHRFFSEFYATEKITAALCHGTAILKWAKTGDGEPLVKNKKVTGFTNAEENAVDELMGQKVMPWRVEDALTKLGAKFVQGDLWEAFAVQDGNLITGQQQMSGKKVADLVIKNLES